jgi:hypothetical protein
MNIIDTIIQNTNLTTYAIYARYNIINEPTIAIPLLSDLSPQEISKLSPSLTHHHDNTISQITTQEFDNLIHLVNIPLEFHPITLPLTIISSKPLPLTTKPSHEEPFIYIISP